MSRGYIIFNCTELDTVDFSQVLDTSSNTVRKSLDKTLTFVKYENPMPSSITSLTTKQGPYTYSEISSILDGEDWTDPNLGI